MNNIVGEQNLDNQNIEKDAAGAGNPPTQGGTSKQEVVVNIDQEDSAVEERVGNRISTSPGQLALGGRLASESSTRQSRADSKMAFEE